MCKDNNFPCPLFVGIIAGGAFNAPGAGVNFQCLPLNPQWLNYNTSVHDPTLHLVSKIRSVEFTTGNLGLFSNTVHQRRALCAQCYTEGRPAITTIPGRTSCPPNWNREYYGYLMASYENYAHPSTYICVDKDPESRSHSNNNYGGGLALVSVDCDGPGTLDECSTGEYINNRQMTCTVCTR